MLTTLATSVIGTLCVAGILAALKSRWLYVIAPKLYLNTPLSDGQIVSLTLMNAGLAAEESVEVTFRPGCRFELVATSKNTLTVTGRSLVLPKLARAESVTVLLLFEGKPFAAEEIESVESKATQGKVVESKEKATPLWGYFVIVPVLLFVLAVPFSFGTYVGSELHTSVFGYASEKLELLGPSLQLAGYQNEVQEYVGQGNLQGSVTQSTLTISVPQIVRRGDILTVQVKVSNNTKQIVTGDGSMEGTAGGRGPLDWTDSRAEKYVLAPGESKTLRFKIFMPASQSVQILQGSYDFSSPGGGSVAARQLINLRTSAEEQQSK